MVSNLHQKSEAQINSTFFISKPQDFHTSIKYSPTILIFSKSPSSLLFNIANQSATQNLNLMPVEVNLFTVIVLINPCAIWIFDEGSKPSYATGFFLDFNNSTNSSYEIISSAKVFIIATLV